MSGPDLANQLRALEQAKRTGTFMVSEGGGRRKYIYFMGGKVQILKSDRCRMLMGKALQKKAGLSDVQLEEALLKQFETGEKLGKICLYPGHRSR